MLPPLFITMVFCFALVLVQQHQTSTRAATKQAYEKTHTKLSPSSLKSIETLQPITVSSSLPASAPTEAGKTSAPAQPSKSSGSATQPAASRTIPADSVINVVADPVKGVVNGLTGH